MKEKSMLEKEMGTTGNGRPGHHEFVNAADFGFLPQASGMQRAEAGSDGFAV